MDRATGSEEAGAASIEAGRRALAEARWDDARRAFEAALADVETPEAHLGRGWAALWADDGERAIEGFDAAHRRYSERGESLAAARAAAWLGFCHRSFRGRRAVAAAWIERARQLLDGVAPAPEHAWVATFEGMSMLEDGDAEAAIELGREAAEAGRSVARPELEALGLAVEGEALVAEGRVAEGMRLLDRAAATTIAAGAREFGCVNVACCSMLAACELSGDLDRASEWCELTSEYAHRHGLRHIFGVCRTSYAGVLIACGRWEGAEAELEPVAGEIGDISPRVIGAAAVRLAELRRRQGRFREAADLFERAGARRDALLGTAALALDRGDPEAACDLAERFLRQTPRLNHARRAVALELLVRARIDRSEVTAAERSFRQLESIAAAAPVESLRALASAAAGRLAAGRGDPDRARRHFEDAIDLFSRCGFPFEAARARLDLADTLRGCGRRSAAMEEAEGAREALAQLGAGHALERAEKLLAGLETEDGVAAPPVRGLTARQLEVLRLVAQGLTNREIAARLVVSEHTVHRHVTNIFNRLGVRSRTAATTYAHRHGLV